MHIVENELSETERAVVKTQIIDQIERTFAESNQAASVTVSFETQSNVYRRLLASRTAIRTTITADNTRGSRQPAFTTDFVGDTLTKILTTIRITVLSETTSVKLQETQAEGVGTGDGIVIAAIGIAIVIGVTGIACCLCYINRNRARLKSP